MSLQVSVSINKTLLFPWPKSQLFLIEEMLHCLNYLCGPSLDSLHQFPVFLELESPELDPVLHVWPHQGRGEGEENLSQIAGHTLFIEPHDTTGLLGHKSTLMVHGQPICPPGHHCLSIQTSFPFR